MNLNSNVQYFNYMNFKKENCVINITCNDEWILLSLIPEKIPELEKKLQQQIDNNDHEKEETEKQINSLWNVFHLTDFPILRSLPKEMRDKYLGKWQKGFHLTQDSKKELDYWIQEILDKNIIRL